MPEASSSFTANVLKLASGSLLAQGLLVLIAPVLTRLFAPDAFGLAALFTSITGIASVIACLRYELSIMLPKSKEDASNLLGVSILFVLITTGVIVLIILFIGNQIAILLNSPELIKYLWLIPIAVFVNGAFLALSYWNSRSKHFGRLSLMRVISSIITGSGSLGAGFSGLVSGGILIAARVLGQLVSAVTLGVHIWWGNRKLFNDNIRWNKMVAGMKRYKNFPIYNIWSALLNTTSQFLPALFLAYYFSPTIVGYYALGLQVLFLPTSLVGQAIGHVFFQKASEAKHQGQLDVVVEKVFRRLVSVGMFPFLLIMLLGKDLFLYVFGPQWSEAGIFAQILSPWIFFAFITSPLTLLFIILEAQKEALFADAFLFFCRCIALIIGGHFDSPRSSIVLFSFVGTFILFFMVFWFFSKARIARQKALVILCQHLLIIFPAILIISWSCYIMKNQFLVTLGISIFCGILYYALVLYRDMEMRRQLVTLSKSIFS